MGLGRLFLVLIALLVAASPLLAKKGRDDADLHKYVYMQDYEYPGMFEKNLIYKLIDENSNWRGSDTPRKLAQVRCDSAKSALQNQGAWYGRLDAKGRCVDGDSIQWVVGNFLNFLGQENDVDSQ